MTEIYSEVLDSFLDRWDLETVKRMSIGEYVGIGNKDTFCQWVETRTRSLGSIKGMTSIKFGIYERQNPNKKPKNYADDDTYSWLRSYGSSHKEAFKNIKGDILRIVQLSEKGQFGDLDDILLPDLFKWKVAFLYSNERLIPIFKRDVLFKIADHYGLQTDKSTTISQIQEMMIAHKPAHLDVYRYMRVLFEKFGRKKDLDEPAKERNSTKGRRKRKGASKRNVQAQVRTVTRSYVAEQKHNKIQERLKGLLIAEFGEDNVLLEENYVDVKLIQPTYLGFYEVKSASYASECIKEALGQVVLYLHHDDDHRQKKLYVVGQFPPNEQDKEFITYVKSLLDIEFDYLNVDIE